MKNYTLKAIGIATLFAAGFNLAAVRPVSALAAQYARQTPAPRAAPAPRPAPTPRPAPAPTPQHQASPSPQHQSTATPQRQATSASERQTQAQHPSQPTPQTQYQQQQSDARQQKQQKLEQRQQEQKARDLKQQQKQQDKKQKAQQKQQEKEQARQQEEIEKQQKQGKVTSNPVHSSAPAATSVGTNSPSSSSASAAAITSGHHAAYTFPGDKAVASKTATGSSVLTREGSRNVVNQLNANRSNMQGMNRKTLPAGDVTVHPNGSLTVKASGGRQYGVRANGTISSFAANGKAASFNSKGRVTSVHTSNMDIRRGANGQRTVLTHRTDNTTVVATGRHSGYIERTVVHNNQTYVQRTVVVNSRIVTHTYIAYGFGGVTLTHFVSPVFYSPAFYGWAFYPWVTPVAYRWRWFSEPWYIGPDPYFVAFATYPSASFWLTDYFLGQTLATAYHEHQEAQADYPDDDMEGSSSLRASVTTPITPELKAAIAEEVKEQIAAENTAAAHPEKAASFGELPSILRERNHVFVVASSLDVTTADQQACELQSGDVLQLTIPPSDGSPLAQLRVASSKKMDCPVGVQVTVSLQDLQDMQNNLRTQIASGLGTLQENQGMGGLPAAPPEALSAPPRPAVVGIETMPTAEVVSMLEAETQQADALELEAAQSALDGQEGTSD